MVIFRTAAPCWQNPSELPEAQALILIITAVESEWTLCPALLVLLSEAVKLRIADRS